MKCLTWLLCLMLLAAPALAEEFDQAALEQKENCHIYMEANHVDTVVRPLSQPYEGQVELEDTELSAFLDYIHMPGEDTTFLRLTLSLTSYDFVAANEMTITVGGKNYVFLVFPQVTEYDMTYYEDYIVCMTDESLPMIKAMARSKKDTFPIKLAGAQEVFGSITLPLDEVAQIYDTYIDLGGAQQHLDACRDTWPVMIMNEGK